MLTRQRCRRIVYYPGCRCWCMPPRHLSECLIEQWLQHQYVAGSARDAGDTQSRHSHSHTHQVASFTGGLVGNAASHAILFNITPGVTALLTIIFMMVCALPPRRLGHYLSPSNHAHSPMQPVLVDIWRTPHPRAFCPGKPTHITGGCALLPH